MFSKSHRSETKLRRPENADLRSRETLPVRMIDTYLIVVVIAVDIELIRDGRRGYSIVCRKRLSLPTSCSQRFYLPV